MLNLIEDAWIPVRCRNGRRRIIAPWQMAEPDVIAPDWQRPDMNIACYELLIGLVYMAAPPKDEEDWEKRADADPVALQKVLARYAPAFHLLGNGPLFMQDFEHLSGNANSVDMLFIDSAGGQTMRNNIDVMVHRDRYGRLPLSEAAMALYMLQDFAPSGGAGNRTSMRGGGPLVTLLDPGRTLWDLIWLNVPFGDAACEPENLPWMKSTRTSEAGQKVRPTDVNRGFDAEAFFGMPRRLRLEGDGDGVSGVIQKPYGTNYADWQHPLSPYYRLKKDSEWLPRHPRAGHFGYRNWLGVIAREGDEGKDEALSQCALILRELRNGRRGRDEDATRISVIVAGWSMNNMSPRDFVLSRQPLLKLSKEGFGRLKSVILAAEQVASLLVTALSQVLEGGEARNAEREEFFLQTEASFARCYRDISEGKDVGPVWLEVIRKQTLDQFNALACSGLAERDMKTAKAIVQAYKFMNLALWGYTPRGRELFQTLGLPVPEKGKRKAA